MKISIYTFLFKIDDRFYIYNSLSNALIEIEKNIFTILLTHKKEHSLLNKEDLNCDELYQILKEKHIITENDQDEFLFYKSIIQEDRKSTRLNSSHP